MNRQLTAVLLGLATLTMGTFGSACRADQHEFVALFDGETLDGWSTYDGKGDWSVVDGVIVGKGPVSHLFSERGDYKNFVFRAEIMINDGGNSGMYFRTEKGPGFPKGYEAQVNSTHRDPVRTGSIYNMILIKKSLHEPDEWFTQEVRVEGNRITVSVNGEELYTFIDRVNSHSQGHFAFQQHDPGSTVKIRKIEVKELP